MLELIKGGSPRHLLVVDDEPDVCAAVCDIAKLANFASQSASNFEDFKEAVTSREPDVIVLDLQMPTIDGIGYLEFLGKISCRSRVILMSGYDQRVLNAARRVATARGVDVADVCEKPLEVKSFIATLQKLSSSSATVSQAALEEFLSKDLVSIHVQPKVSLCRPKDARLQGGMTLTAGGRRWNIEGVEVLARLTHPQYGKISPDNFISVAESCGLIGPLTDRVLLKSLAQQKLWMRSGVHVPVAVNVAPGMVRDPDLPDRLHAYVKDAGIDEHLLTLEITETAAMEPGTQPTEALMRLRLKGFGLSLDDFGTGFSSLVRLYRLPFSELKIDRSLISEVTQSDEAKVIVRSTIQLAHNLNMKVCAEGIEDVETADFLIECGCDVGQGFLFSRPLPVEVFSSDILGLDPEADLPLSHLYRIQDPRTGALKNGAEPLPC